MPQIKKDNKKPRTWAKDNPALKEAMMDAFNQKVDGTKKRRRKAPQSRSEAP